MAAGFGPLPVLPARGAMLPPGLRLYAIGDVHGHLDLFEQLVAAIRADNAARPAAEVKLLVLGDLIDRGPDSAALVRRCRALANASDRFIVLMGNHEAAMVEALRGDQRALAAWLPMGGDATLRSWQVDPAVIAQGPSLRLIRAARAAVTDEILGWLDSLPLSVRIGDYLFVHAGIRPGIELSLQDDFDLLRIREPFLESDVDHGMIIVHGHSISSDGPELRGNRIGIDTGAYRTGRLTAVMLEAHAIAVLSTEAGER